MNHTARAFPGTHEALRDAWFSRTPLCTAEEAIGGFHEALVVELCTLVDGVVASLGEPPRGVEVVTVSALARGSMSRWSPVSMCVIAESAGAAGGAPLVAAIQRAAPGCRVQMLALDTLGGALEAHPLLACELVGAAPLWGEGDLTAALGAILAEFRQSRGELLAAALFADVARRQSQHGGTLYLLEPDVQTAPGGVADAEALESLAWLLAGRRSLSGLADVGLLAAAQLEELRGARRFMTM